MFTPIIFITAIPTKELEAFRQIHCYYYLIVFINFVIVRNGFKNQLKEQELKIYKTYLPVIEQLMNDIRARQHELDNHLQALRMMPPPIFLTFVHHRPHYRHHD
jgi:hypothetical protein